MALTDSQLEILFKPLNPVRVAKLEGKFSYLETWDVLAHLSRIFGPTGWDKEVSYEVVYETDRGSNRWDVAYSAKCRLTVRDAEGNVVCVHEDAATGSAANQPSRADAHDLALKSAVSDALKRAAKDLGNQFGLSLYDDGSTKSVLGSSLAHPDIKPKSGEWVWKEL